MLPSDLYKEQGNSDHDVQPALPPPTNLEEGRTDRQHPEFSCLEYKTQLEQGLGCSFFSPIFEYPLNSDLLLAAPQNLNPGLAIPPLSPLDITGPVEELENLPLEENNVNENDERNDEEEKQELRFSLEGLSLDYRTESDNFGGFRQIIEPTFEFNLTDGHDLSITTGFNTFDQVDVARVTNIPLDITWHHNVDNSSIDISIGLDWFNRLPLSPRIGFSGSTPLFEGATLSGVIEYQPYKFNTQTLESKIKSLRLGPNLFWQINSDTYLFSLLRLGTYNDGNTEQQSFSRIEHRIGDFGIATNLFNWVYRDDVEMQSGYFSPPDFLVYNGEIFWEDEIIDEISCQVTASAGLQRLNGAWTSAYSYGPACQVNIGNNVQLSLGYSFSNVRDQMTGGSAFNNRTVTGELAVEF